jgi:spore maturation protein CgeB
MNIIFFNSETLVARELCNALNKRKDIRLINVKIPFSPPSEHAGQIFETFEKHTPALVLSINDAGYDTQGKLQEYIIASGSYIANWYHDYPFYYHQFHNRAYTPSSQRIDFVSEKSYTDILESKGYAGHFLPLAADPAYFNTDSPRIFERDIAFVGNSSLQLMDIIITEEMAENIENCKTFHHDLKKAYYDDFTRNIRDLIFKNRPLWEHRITVPEEKFVFAMEWMIGFQYRRDFLVDISNTYKDRFVLFGDLYWKQYVKESKVTPEACYYDNLCRYYRTTKINLNVNRIQIRTSFTQRHFDTKAAGAFLLTDKRECNGRYFITEGPDKEIVEYESLAHCKKLIDYYLVHEEERERIAENGIENVLRNHTYNNRITEILEVCRKTWGI